MAETFSIERRKLMRFLGAKVIITPAAARAVGMVKKTEELAEKHGWYYTRQFENEANADMHSRTTAQEILRDFAGERLDYWVTGFGTGGTLKGVARVLAKERPETKIVVCEPDEAPMLSSGIEQERNADGSAAAAIRAGSRIPCRAGARTSSPSSPAMPCPRKPISQVLRIANADAMRCSKELAKKEGIFVGITSGGTFAGALQVAVAGAEGLDDPLHAARYRRALPQHSPLRRRLARHERGGVGDRPFHPRLHSRAAEVAQSLRRSAPLNSIPQQGPQGPSAEEGS